MKDYGPETFGRRFADIYDGEERADTPDTVEVLADLAAGGRVLELAIGTGRVGLKLADRGLHVDGIEASPEMVERLRAKPGGEALEVTIGNYADVGVEGSYRLIFVVYNTLSNLATQDEQVRCFENVAAHLDHDGLFVVESLMPTYLHRLRNNQYVDAESVEQDEIWLDVARHDPVTQVLDENHVTFSPAGIRMYPVVTRYTWPSELDLMARLAGLRLHERWEGWRREPFTATGTTSISVYGR